jgi:hypothetical protein
MLTGGARTQAALLSELGEWSNSDELVRALGDQWKRVYFFEDDAVHAARRGPMGATLQAPGGRGHMVMTEPKANGSYLVRDPADGGSTYTVNDDWLRRWVSVGVVRI